MFDVNANAVHNIFFPSKLLASSNGKHQYDITLTAVHDNGTLVNRGTWNSFDNYNEGAVGGTNSFAGIIRQEDPTNPGNWLVEVTADTDLVILYNSPVSPYPEEKLQNEALFYNAIGDVVRGFELAKGDIFSLSTSGFSGVPVANKALTYASGKYVVAS